MTTGEKTALILGLGGIAAGAAYYFLIYKPSQTSASNALTQISSAVAANQIQPSQYEGKLIRSPDTGKVYIVKDGYKQWITSPAVLSRLGYNMGEVTNLPISTIDNIPTGSSISGLSGFRI